MSTSLSWLRAEIQQRMLDKLQPIQLKPKKILIEPDFPGFERSLFTKRFPNAQIDTIADPQQTAFQLNTLRAKRFLSRLISDRGRVLMDQEIAHDAQYDLLINNLCLQNRSSPDEWLAMAYEQISEGGLICFSYLGPDTGKELRAEGLSERCLQSLPGAWDMHDVGDALIQKRYSDPVMDMEYLYLEYQSNQALFKDALGLGLIHANTPNSEFGALTTKKLTLEIVYGHAWVLDKNLSRGSGKTAYIRADAIKRK